MLLNCFISIPIFFSVPDFSMNVNVNNKNVCFKYILSISNALFKFETF